MELSYTGKLFRRIVISSGYTYGKQLRVSCTNLKIKYSSEYDDYHMWECTYRRNKEGRWMAYLRVEYFDNQYNFWKALRWLESNGYITVSWGEKVYSRKHPLLSGIDDFIRLTDKGLNVAPKYLAR